MEESCVCVLTSSVYIIFCDLTNTTVVSHLKVKYCVCLFICLFIYIIGDRAQTGNVSTEFGSPFEGLTRSCLVPTSQYTQNISYKVNLANGVQRKYRFSYRSNITPI